MFALDATTGTNSATRGERGSGVDGTRILVVDDEGIVREIVERYLIRDGYTVRVAADGDTALRMAREELPDLVILDLMLPIVDGIEVCRRLRAEGNVPIIMLTAKGEETDRIVGLSVGADDYMVKPFSPRELVARVKAVLRRTQSSASGVQGGQDGIRFPGLMINLRTRTVEVQDKAVSLTRTEFDLLAFLAGKPGQVFTRDQLLDQVWDYEYPGDPSTVTVHMRRLREKVEEDPVRPRHLKTVWGVGYKFEP